MSRYFRPSSRRQWEPDCILPGVADGSRPCRVCSGPIAAGETILRRQWNDATISHAACGWGCATDPRAVELNADAKALVAAELAKRGAA